MRAITLNQAREPAEGTGLRLLHTLFSGSLSPDEWAEILERDYSIVFNQEEKKMFDMFRYAEEKGRTKGRREGKKEGAGETYQKVIRRLLLKGNSLEEIREMLELTPKQMQDFAPTMEN